MDPVIIWGAGGHAAVVAEILELSGKWEIVGLVDDVDPGRRGLRHEGHQILGGGEILAQEAYRNVRDMAVAIGDCAARRRVADRIKAAGWRLITAIHPTACISSKARLGAGVVCCAGATVGPWCEVGEGSIINTRASVDHHCHIGAYAHIAPGAVLGGVVVGTDSWVGLGASIIDKRTVGRRTTVGAGAVVVRDIPNDCVAVGVPARVVRSNV